MVDGRDILPSHPRFLRECLLGCPDNDPANTFTRKKWIFVNTRSREGGITYLKWCNCICVRNRFQIIVELINELWSENIIRTQQAQRRIKVLTGTAVGILSSAMTSSGMLSRYFTSALSELPCAAIITLFPDFMVGAISDFKLIKKTI